MRQKESTMTVSMTPDSEKTCQDYFGKNYIYEEVHKNQLFQAFNSKCRELNKICGELLLDIGEAQVLIGRFWTQIKYGEFESVGEWIKNNYFRRIQILEPEIHNQIMQQQNGSGVLEYQEWFKKHDQNHNS